MPERLVHFYRIVDAFGQELATQFQWRQALGVIRNLNVATGMAHLTEPDGQVLFGQVIENPRNGPGFMALYRIRQEDLPSLEARGRITDLPLNADEGLAEAIHVCFFPGSVIGLLYNHYGPRVGRLAKYMNMKANLNPTIGFQPILRPDILDKLNELSQISLVDMRVPVAQLDRIRDQGLASALRAASRVATSQKVSLKLEVDWRNPQVSQRLRDLFAGLVRTGRATSFEKLKIRGLNEETDQREWLDVLAEHITVQSQVTTRSHASRTVSDDSARRAIGDAHAASEADIRSALEFRT